MGRKTDGATPRTPGVAIRLNHAELEELEEKRGRRGLDRSNYFRTLMHEDEGPR